MRFTWLLCIENRTKLGRLDVQAVSSPLSARFAFYNVNQKQRTDAMPLPATLKFPFRCAVSFTFSIINPLVKRKNLVVFNVNSAFCFSYKNNTLQPHITRGTDKLICSSSIATVFSSMKEKLNEFMRQTKRTGRGKVFRKFCQHWIPPKLCTEFYLCFRIIILSKQSPQIHK